MSDTPQGTADSIARVRLPHPERLFEARARRLVDLSGDHPAAPFLALLVTGIVLWRPYFAPEFSLTTRRTAAVVHAIFAFIMFVGIGIHVYAAIWTRGAMRAMTQGWVTRRWARYHHPGWYRKVVGKDAP